MEKYKATIGVIILVCATIIPSFVQGAGSAVTNLLVQIEWCSQGNYTCHWLYNMGAIIVFVGIAFVIDRIVISRASQPVEFGKPTRENLKHKIGLDAQKLQGQFKLLNKKSSLEDKRAQYGLASNTLDSIHDDLLPHAKLILKDTSIPETIIELRQSFGFLWIRTEGAFLQKQSAKDQIPDLLYRVEVTAKALEEVVSKIDSLLNRLIELCADK